MPGAIRYDEIPVPDSTDMCPYRGKVHKVRRFLCARHVGPGINCSMTAIDLPGAGT